MLQERVRNEDGDLVNVHRVDGSFEIPFEDKETNLTLVYLYNSDFEDQDKDLALIEALERDYTVQKHDVANAPMFSHIFHVTIFPTIVLMEGREKRIGTLSDHHETTLDNVKKMLKAYEKTGNRNLKFVNIAN